MAYTLQDYARLAKSDLKAGIVDVFRRESFVMDLMSFENIDGLSVQILRTKTLPTVGWRKIGGTWSPSKATFEPIQENIYNLGGNIDIDKLLVKAKAVVDQRSIQTDAFITSLAYEFQDYFLNGDPTVEPDGFTGLWKRIKLFEPGMELNAAGLDVSPDGATLAAAQLTLIDHLQSLQHRTEGHKCDAIFSNDTLYLRLLSALRASGLYDTTKDNYNRTVATYGPDGPKMYDIGYKADQTTRIIGNVELTNGTAKTAGTATSCYAVKFGEKFLMGIQLYPPDVEDAGLLESGVAYRTTVDWPLGIYAVNPRSFAQLSGVVAA